MKEIILIILAILISQNADARVHRESWYQERWCEGLIEYVLPDRARVDCLTPEYAVEVDFADKWAEAIGQSLYYASMTDRQPAILLIMENPAKDWVYLVRLYWAVSILDTRIRLFTIQP